MRQDDCSAKVGTHKWCEFGVNVDLGSAAGSRDDDYFGTYGEEVFAAGSGGLGSSTVYSLKEGIERFMITDINNPAGSAMAQSNIPVMLDAIASAIERIAGKGSLNRMADRYNHLPGGCNVLFMDGHVEFIKYPGKHPITQYFAASQFGGGTLPTPDTNNFWDHYSKIEHLL